VKKQSRFLITTALESTWVSDQPVLFLGDWCQIYSRRNLWKNIDGVVLPYHWHDRDKLISDYPYLGQLYERFLPVLTAKLNQLHAVKHELRYWRILIGPWLLRIIHILFDRWQTLQQAFNCYELTGTIVLSHDEDCDDEVIPENMMDFVRLFQGDEWNHYIYAEILEYEYRLARTIKKTESKPIVAQVASVNNGVKSLSVKCREFAARYFAKGNKFYFQDTYLPTSALIRLSLSLFQIPQRKQIIKPPRITNPTGKRTWTLDVLTNSRFEEFLLRMIPRQIPKLYVEGYAALTDMLIGLPLPEHPRAIFSSNSLWYDDVAKIYTASKLEQGAVLLYGQHGGGYGTARLSIDEAHEIQIADRYLSFGWEIAAEKKILPIGHFGFRKVWSGSFQKKTQLLFTTFNSTRYTFRGCTESATDINSYIENAFSFIDTLDTSIQKQTLVRLTPDEKGWCYPERWRDRHPKISVDGGDTKIYKLMSEARLVVATYNQSTILETLAFGIPSVLYCDLYQTPLRATAVPFYDILKQVGIFHETPESAARHVNKVWVDVDAWWSSDAVQQAVLKFTQHYCRREQNTVQKIRKILKSMPTDVSSIKAVNSDA
jgi:putative transferase (TIGR04331 family)